MGCLFSAEEEPSVGQGGPLSVRGGAIPQSPSDAPAKVVLLGDSGVGKSSICARYCRGSFSSDHEVTIGANFMQQLASLSNGQAMNLQIWDTGGQERFRAITPLYYRGAAGALIVWDCSVPETFETVGYWTQELRSKGRPDVSIVTVANKVDCGKNQRILEQCREFCESEKIDYVECSAKTGESVTQAFHILAHRIMEARMLESRNR